jgi:pyrroloquinoline quinone biosynthesis protein E
MSAIPNPLALIAELTHRCPLHCVYCSNPQELESRTTELSTADWCRVFKESAELGVLQTDFTGGEPLARTDIVDLVRAARTAGLYVNLITSGLPLDEARLDALIAAGLDHFQLSFQGANEETAEIPQMLAIAKSSSASRVEFANVQYYGWAVANRSELLPTRAQLDASLETLQQAQEKFRGRIRVEYVVPDYYAKFPKPCMGGWGRKFLLVAPSGEVLPCHAAKVIPGLSFDNVQRRSVREIWESSEAFQKFRGQEWMQEPCRSCERRELDFGGCRCQALLLAGDAAATDPVCSLSPKRGTVDAIVAGVIRSAGPPISQKIDWIYRTNP